MRSLSSRGSWKAALAIAAGFSFVSASIAAESRWNDAQLGMSAEQLRNAVPALKRVLHPVRMTGGLVGTWSGPATAIGGISFAPTYFFADGALRRIEYVASTPEPATAFGVVQAWGRTRWGTELASQSPEGSYATWVRDDEDVYLEATSASQRPVLRLVVKQHVVKDGSAL